MPKRTDPALRERAVRRVREHQREYPSQAKAIAAVARQQGVGAETLRRWGVQADIDAGDREGRTSKEHAEIKRLKAENRRLREDVAIFKAATTFLLLRGRTRRRLLLMVAFIDDVRGQGFAAWSIMRVLREPDVDDRRTYLACV